MKNVLIISFLFGSLGVVSQKQIDNQNGAWLMYFGNHKLTEKFSLHTEYQWRRSDYFNNWQQSLARVGIDYHFNKQNSVTAGYGWIVSYPYGEQPAELFNFLAIFLGVISMVTFVLHFKKSKWVKYGLIVSLALSTVLIFVGKLTGTSGGEIRHTEIRE
jgi:hypothetical protein